MTQTMQQALAEIENNDKLTAEQKIKRQAALVKAYRSMLPPGERQLTIRNKTGVGRVFAQALARGSAKIIIGILRGR